MINLHLREIRSFVGLADAGSFNLAADRLGISQPALSAHIRNLEHAYGVSLVHRTTRQVTLTPEGQAFASRARRALMELEAATRGLREISAAHKGQVFLACIPPLTASVMPEIVQALNADYPAVEVSILDVLSAQVGRLVLDHSADLGIGPANVPSGAEFEHLIRDEFVAAVPRTHPLSAATEVALSELADHPMILNSQDTTTRRILDRAFDHINRPVRPRFEFVHYASVGSFVEAGLGITVLPRSVVPTLGGENTVTLEIRGRPVYRDLGLITRRAYEPSPAARALIHVVRRKLASS